MTDFRLARRRAMINFPVRHQPSADTASQGHIENRIGTSASATARFPERRHVRIIIHAHPRPGQFFQPDTQIKFRPTGNLMGATDFATLPIHRSAETHADRIYR